MKWLLNLLVTLFPNASNSTKDTTYIVTGVGNAIEFILPYDSHQAYAEFTDRN